MGSSRPKFVMDISVEKVDMSSWTVYRRRQTCKCKRVCNDAVRFIGIEDRIVVCRNRAAELLGELSSILKDGES